MLLQASADTPGQTGRPGLASCVAKSCGFSISQDSSGVSLSWLTILYPLPSCWALLGQANSKPVSTPAKWLIVSTSRPAVIPDSNTCASLRPTDPLVWGLPATLN